MTTSTGDFGTTASSNALPFASIRLTVGNPLDQTKSVAADDKAVSFNVTLKGGTKLPMQSYGYVPSGKVLCGAYFADVTRK